jgi:protocatechuate 3,4-dioxygenase beta subunit
MNIDDRQGRLLSRREMLSLIGAAGAAILARPAMAQSGPAPISCIATPEQTEGPYFVDERLNRSDIRSDPSDGSVREGVPLALRLAVSSIGKDGCKPVAGAIVDIWHCDALGNYSDTMDPHTSTAGKKFLRGYQVTGQDGVVRFTTIYPGWYPGRAVHIHFKVRINPNAAQAHEFTSQLYFDDAVTDRVHTRAPYVERGRRRVRNERDGLFRDGGDQLMLRLAESAQGYAGSFNIGLQMR